MGFLYKEIVEYKHHDKLKMILLLALLLTTTLVTLLFNSLNGSISIAVFASTLVLAIGSGAMVYAWDRCRKRYKYSIIADELIIERIKGEKKKVVFNINVKYITAMEKTPKGCCKEDILNAGKFSCSGKKDSVYYCTCKKDGKKSGFYFEPSENLKEKINIMMKSAV